MLQTDLKRGKVLFYSHQASEDKIMHCTFSEMCVKFVSCLTLPDCPK